MRTGAQRKSFTSANSSLFLAFGPPLEHVAPSVDETLPQVTPLALDFSGMLALFLAWFTSLAQSATNLVHGRRKRVVVGGLKVGKRKVHELPARLELVASFQIKRTAELAAMRNRGIMVNTQKS